MNEAMVRYQVRSLDPSIAFYTKQLHEAPKKG